MLTFTAASLNDKFSLVSCLTRFGILSEVIDKLVSKAAIPATIVDPEFETVV